MNSTLTREVPPELVALAVAAIRAGSPSVSLGFGSQSYNPVKPFKAPISWVLWMEQPGVARSDLINFRVGDEFADIDMPAWVAETADGGHAIASLIPMFESGIANGWSVKYERGTAPAGDSEDSFHRLRATAPDWTWDEESRARGDAMSVEVYCTVWENSAHPVTPQTTEGGELHDVDMAHVETILNRQAPKFQRVAYSDGTDRGWVM